MNQKLFHRDFTMVVIGQIISIFGNVILRFALSQYLLDITGSPLMFGSITAVSMLPTILLSPFGGMLADRVNKRNIMVALDFLTAALILVFGLVLREVTAVSAIAAVMIVLALIQAFYTPSVTASVPLLQAPENLVAANAVVNQVNMVANTVGPVLGGVVYGFFGIRSIVALSSVCFLLSAVLELFIRIPHKPQAAAGGMWGAIRADFTESTRFLRREQPSVLRMTVMLAGINFFFSAIIAVGFPILLRIRMGMGAQMFGVAEGLVSAAGIAGGVLTGLLASKFRLRSLHRMLLVVGGTLLPVAAVCWLPVPDGISAGVVIGSTMVAQGLSCIFSIVTLSAIQRHTPAHLLGKITAYISTICMCAIPLGQAVYAALFEIGPGADAVIFAGAAFCTILLGLWSRGPIQALDSEIPTSPPAQQEI